MSDAILQAALDYAVAGFSVIPVKVEDKAPYTDNGLSGATTDPEVIRLWWKRWPRANVAIVTGKPSGNRFAIDVDIKPNEGKHGDQELLKWQAQHGDFPNTVQAVTGSGGLHYWFHCDQIAQYKNKVNALPGIDIRGDGAYVVAPPSVYEDGRIYQWENDVSILDDEIAEANDSVIELLKLNPKFTKGREKKSQYKSLTVIEKGHRQDALMSLQGSLVNLNLTTEAIKAAVREENESKCDPPMTEEELEKEIFPFLNRNTEPGSDYAETVVPAQTLDDGITEDELDMPTLDQISQEKAEWLEIGYIPKKTITILCGTGGVGKTSIWCSIAAAVSRGEQSLLTAGSEIVTDVLRDNRKVMFFSAEDSVGVVLKEKMARAGAVQRNIGFFDVSDKRFQNIQFSSPLLEKLIAKHRPALCIFDPIQAFINKKVKMSDRNAMRQEIEPLIRMGQRYETTFLLIMHTNKQSNVWGRQRMADSADLWDVARSVLMVGDTAEEGFGYISQEKNSYARQAETVIFKITEGIATWHSKSKKKDKDFVLEASKIRNHDKSGDVEDACNFILSALAETKEGRLPVGELDEQLGAFGYSGYSIRKAKKNLKEANLIFYKKDGYEGKSFLCTLRNRQD